MILQGLLQQQEAMKAIGIIEATQIMQKSLGPNIEPEGQPQISTNQRADGPNLKHRKTWKRYERFLFLMDPYQYFSDFTF